MSGRFLRFSSFAKDVALLFLALRAADVINLVAGLYLVPHFIPREELGAVLPVVTSATVLAMPAFAFAVVLMKESNCLASRRAYGSMKSLLRGAFVGTALLLALSLALSVLVLPRLAREMRVSDQFVPFAAMAAAFLGCFAPVYMDALNGLKRFKAYGLTEIAASVARIVVMAIVMPFRAFIGFFAGNAAQPLVRIGVSVFALRKDLAVRAEPYWTRSVVRRIALLFFGVLAALVPPMFISLVEQSLVRSLYSADLSALYYLETRLSDILNYLTLPLMLVLFPYSVDAAEKGGSARGLVLRSSLAALLAALLLAGIYSIWGLDLLAMLGSQPIPSAARTHVLILLAINLLTAVQVFIVNAEIAAGRFRFLFWYLPLHLVYFAFLSAIDFAPSAANDLMSVLPIFLFFAFVRTLCCSGFDGALRSGTAKCAQKVYRLIFFTQGFV